MTLPMSLRDVVERNMPRIELRAGILEKLEADLLNELASVQPLPGAIEALQHLRDLGYRLAVASTSPCRTPSHSKTGWAVWSTSRFFPLR